MQRRSTNRSAATRKKYTVDAFEGIEELRDVISSEDEFVADSGVNDDSGNDFEGGAEESPEEEEMSGLDDDLDGEFQTPKGSTTSRRQSTTKRYRTGGQSAGFLAPLSRPTYRQPQTTTEKTYVRSVPENSGLRAESKETKRLHFYGASVDDYAQVLKAMAHWTNQTTLPSRNTNEETGGCMHSSFFVEDNDRNLEASNAKKWWVSGGGKGAFTQRQSTRVVDDQEAAAYMPELESAPREVLLGPHANQDIYILKPGDGMPLRDAWDEDEASVNDAASVEKQPYKNGFLLNLGARIQSVSWAPQRPGSNQYLVVSVKLPADAEDASASAREAPAFTPQSPRKSSIQIWKFRADINASIDVRSTPELVHNLCTTWGDIRALSWSPAPGHESDAAQARRLGLLACICGDGGLRVINVVLSANTKSAHHHVVQSVVFESRPPDTLYTCLTWISGTRLAAGCANGCVALLDMPTSSSPKSGNVRPTTYSATSPSYIRAVESGYPSKPNLLLTSDMNGFVQMTDLSQPGSSLCSASMTVSGWRSRIPIGLLAWHEFGQFIVHAEENFTVRGASIRRPFSSTSLGRGQSTATALAASKCHPILLIGSAGGDVVASNPTDRMLAPKRHLWQQTWFNHEWRRSVAQHDANADAPHDESDDTGDAAMEDNDSPRTSQHDTSAQGLTRIVEGFKAERALLNWDQDHDLANTHDGVQFATTYEEQTAITALAWNPNPHVGGWAAAGMGDGLLRVEDIAI